MNGRIMHGVDLVSVHPVAFKVSEKDQKFFEKIFTPAEILYCQSKDGDTNQALSFAARLAAKGAVAKMLGANYETAGFKDIEVINDNLGKPMIKLYGKTAELALKIGIKQEDIAISISHTDELSVASAVAVIQDKKEGQKEAQKMKKTKKTGTVKVVDETIAEESITENRGIFVINGNLVILFTAISKEAGLVPEFQREKVDDYYGISYIVINLRTGPPTNLVIARFSTREGNPLPPVIIQFNSAYKDRLNSFVAAVKKAAENLGIDIEIRVVKELS